MATVSKAIVDAALREGAFSAMGMDQNEVFKKVNDQTYGIILTDQNGIERYVRAKVVIAEIKEDMTAREYMEAEQAEYAQKQANKAEEAKRRAEKAKRDKEKRAAAKKKKEEIDD